MGVAIEMYSGSMGTSLARLSRVNPPVARFNRTTLGGWVGEVAMKAA
jgi:hypothetical protein